MFHECGTSGAGCRRPAWRAARQRKHGALTSHREEEEEEEGVGETERRRGGGGERWRNRNWRGEYEEEVVVENIYFIFT